MLADLTRQLAAGLDLSAGQVAAAVQDLVQERINAEEKADFLLALARKGESTAEIAAFARHLRERALCPPIDASIRAEPLIDVCGTGGDGLHTFNISTTAAIVAAAAGVRVAKHGNRAVTSKAGSADVLEALGIRIDLDPEQAVQALRAHGFAFFFAPFYHPAFKHIETARRLCAQQGRRTIFNFLGPLLNPARPSGQLIGVPRPELCGPIAEVLKRLGVRRGMVVSGQAGPSYLDEFSTLGVTQVAEFYHDRGMSRSELAPGHFGLARATLEDLRGGDARENAAIARSILAGGERGPRRDAVLLNASAALLVADRAKSLTAGLKLAGEIIDNGLAGAKLKALSGAA